MPTYPQGMLTEFANLAHLNGAKCMLLEDRLEGYYFNKLFCSLKQVKMKVYEHEYLKSTFILFVEILAFVLNSLKVLIS